MRTRALPGNRRLAILMAGVGIVALAAALIIRMGGGGDGEAPAGGAARLLPEDTLVYVNVSTDGDREAVDQAAAIASRFGAYEPARDALLKRFSGGEQGVDAERDVAPWLGDEAAFALMDSGAETAGSLVAVEVTDEERAKAFLDRNPVKATRNDFKGHPTYRYGRVTTAFAGGFMLIGQDATVQGALERDQGRLKALEGEATYRRAIDGIPEGRVVTAYASADGVRRLLAPQGDVLGAVSATLDQPALQGVAVAVAPEGTDRVRVHVHSALDAARQRDGEAGTRQFEPQLVDAVPKDALAYLGVSGVENALQGLLLSSLGGGSGLSDVLGRLATELDEETGGGLRRDLLKLLEGEVALVVQRAMPAPVLSIVADAEDEAATRQTLDRLRDPLAKLLRPEGEAAPTWAAQDVEGADAWTLSLPNGAAITYAVGDGRFIVSTGVDGVRRLLAGGDSIEDSETFEKVVDGRPDVLGTLGFLDFSQLLELGEQTGLNDSATYLAVRDDLQKVRALGISSTSGEGESTAEILVSIP